MNHDQSYENIRHGGSVRNCAVLLAASILPSRDLDPRRQRVAFVSDDHAGLKQAHKDCFPEVLWQRCQFHLQLNAGHYAPQVSICKEIARDLWMIFDAPDIREAQRLVKLTANKHAKTAPQALAVD